jgi:hypothetical protein
MSDQALLNTLKALNYDNATIKAIMAAAETAEIERLQASRGDVTELLTPVQAASKSAKHAAQLRQLDRTIYNASGCRWHLPTDGSTVDLLELNRAIGNAPIDTRAAIRCGLHQLGLIPA